MEILFMALGVGLLVVTVAEALWTTLWVDGAAGPVTSRTTSWAWTAVRRLGRSRHRLLSMCGPLILTGTVVGWVLTLWAGWVLLFAADPQSLADTRDGGNATWAGRIWFVGYTLFTVGNGDFSPKDGMWQVLSGLVSASGMFLVTLSVTYLLSVVSAVVNKRAFASSVHSLGRTGAEVVLAGWNGRDLHPLDRQLADLTSQLSKLTEQYLSYPVLLYYHAARSQKSPALAVGGLRRRADPAALRSTHRGPPRRGRADGRTGHRGQLPGHPGGRLHPCRRPGPTTPGTGAPARGGGTHRGQGGVLRGRGRAGRAAPVAARAGPPRRLVLVEGVDLC